MTVSHIVIPDTQAKPGINLAYLEWVGRYIGERKPDVIVHLGDHWDMPSLSSYDKGKKKAEGKRYQQDVDAGNEGMARLIKGIKTTGGARYRPRKVFLIGNHEQRIERHVEANAELDGKLSYNDLELSGWEVHDFLESVDIHGIAYSHYFPRSASGRITQSKSGAPNALAQLRREGGSCTAGHMQGLDIACLPFKGRMQWGLIAGSCYLHEESYLTPQGRGASYWRGLIVKHEVYKGSYSPMLVSLDYLQKRYGKEISE
jgi:hypothetical protein